MKKTLYLKRGILRWTKNLKKGLKTGLKRKIAQQRTQKGRKKYSKKENVNKTKQKRSFLNKRTQTRGISQKSAFKK